MLPRVIAPQIVRVLRDYGKMAFVSGPRQVGKTTLARALGADFGQSAYFNWDVITDQKKLLKKPYFFESEDRDPSKPFLLILDEIHKYARWRNYLKGAYDKYQAEFRFLITGSGRLDLFKKGGDSLLGRYFSVPLLPLSLGELAGRMASWTDFKAALNDPPALASGARDAYGGLFRFSGFPEPFSRGEEAFYNLWFQERKTLLVREDIRDASAIRELSLLETLSHLIPERVGAPFSINSLKEDVGVAFETVRDWVLLLEKFYYLFRVPPFAQTLARVLRKEPKVYLYDWVEVPQEGHRFENLAALHLLKAVQVWRSLGAGDIALYYVRDKEKREADFLITERGRPICVIECKTSQLNLSPSLLYWQQRLRAPTAVQLLHSSGVCRKTALEGGAQWIISADRWLGLLP